MLKEIATRLIARYQRRAALKSLLQLDDRTLKDIGYQRDEVMRMMEEDVTAQPRPSGKRHPDMRRKDIATNDREANCAAG